MGWIETRINGGPHTAVLQLGIHKSTPINSEEEVARREAGGVIGFSGIDAPIKRQNLLFLELQQSIYSSFQTASSTEREQIFRKQMQNWLESVNFLFIAEKSGHRDQMSPLQRYILDHKPDIVFPDVFNYPPLKELDEREQTHQQAQAYEAQGAALLAGATTAALFAKKMNEQQKQAEQLGRRKKDAAVKITRRQFLKKMAGLAAATGLGLIPGHELEPGWNWRHNWLAQPGPITGLREMARRFDAWRNNSLTEVRLRNAIVAEKIARICNKLYGNQPASVGILFGVGHGGMKEMLEHPDLRQQTIQRQQNLSQLIDEQYSGVYEHLRYDPKTQKYVLTYSEIGYK